MLCALCMCVGGVCVGVHTGGRLGKSSTPPGCVCVGVCVNVCVLGVCVCECLYMCWVWVCLPVCVLGVCMCMCVCVCVCVFYIVLWACHDTGKKYSTKLDPCSYLVDVEEDVVT